jgi:integrase
MWWLTLFSLCAAGHTRETGLDLRQRTHEGSSTTWPEAIERNYIRPAEERAKITKHISWHVFRHTFSTLLAENDEDVKTVQSLMRHANSNITMNIYTHAVSSKKRRAQSKVGK